MRPTTRADRLAALRLRLSGWCPNRWASPRIGAAQRTRLVHAIRRLDREAANVAAGRRVGWRPDAPPGGPIVPPGGRARA